MPFVRRFDGIAGMIAAHGHAYGMAELPSTNEVVGVVDELLAGDEPLLSQDYIARRTVILDAIPPPPPPPPPPPTVGERLASLEARVAAIERR